MQKGEKHRFRGIEIPFLPEISIYRENDVLYLSEAGENFLISVDERIYLNCKGKKEAKVLEKDGLLLRLYFPENTGRNYLFFQLEVRGKPETERLFGQIVFSGKRVEEGLKLLLLKRLWEGLNFIKENITDAD